MLDVFGFVAETNATNLFMVMNNELHTPEATSCLPGITRRIVIQIAKENKIPVFERKISLAEFYIADQVFTTGTMGELTPVKSIDNRLIENQNNTTIFEKILKAFHEKTETEGEAF